MNTKPMLRHSAFRNKCIFSDHNEMSCKLTTSAILKNLQHMKTELISECTVNLTTNQM